MTVRRRIILGFAFGFALLSLLVPGLDRSWGADGTEPAMDASATARMIDARIDRALSRASLEPAPAAEGERLVRRLSLDINGVIPGAKTIGAYLKSKDKDKTLQLINALIDAPAFDRHFADVFGAAWVGRKNRPDSGYFRPWLQEQFKKRRRFDAIVRDLIGAEGALDDNGASYFGLRWEAEPANFAAQSARVFMGLQIQCAQCHDHPFTEWKQEQFHEFAAYFAGIRRGNKRVGDRNIPSLMQTRNRNYRYKIKSSGQNKRFSPRFLFDLEGVSQRGPRREVVARLMTHPENPFFAKMTVNRVWKAMFGRGLVEPAEDLEGQDGYHPMLHEALAADFVASGYDLRHLVRSVALSRAYQRSSRRPKNQKDPSLALEKLAKSKDAKVREEAARKAQEEVWLFARASVRPLTPEQIVSSLFRATGVYSDGPDDASMGDMGGQGDKWKNLRRSLLRQFDALYGDEGASNPDAFDGTIPQTLLMLNGRFVNEAIKPLKGTMMAQILTGSTPTRQVVRSLFLAVLSRRPGKSEERAFTGYLRSQGSTQETYEDLMWALINSSEFLMNH